MLNEVAALEILQDHSVYYKVRSDITIVCKGMQFSRFPLDQHRCLFKLSSFGYDISQLKLSGKFSHNPRDQRVLQFSTEFTELAPDDKVYVGASKNYSIYGVELRLSRVLSPFILSVYLPSAMFVVMSWVSFFIPPDIVPARIVLLVTLCLVLINMFNSTTSKIPVSNSVTALEIWLLACVILVFFSLLEYSIILWDGAKKINEKTLNLKTVSREKSMSNVKLMSRVYHDYPDNVSDHPQIITKIDKSVNVIQMVKSKSAGYICPKPSDIQRFSLIEDSYGENDDENDNDSLDNKQVMKSLLPKRKVSSNASNSKSEAGKSGARCCTSNNYVNLDKHSAVLFPFIFVIFNLVYWTYFVLI